MACRNGHYDVAEYLIEKCGADVEQPGSGQICNPFTTSIRADLFTIENNFSIKNDVRQRMRFSAPFFLLNQVRFFSWHYIDVSNLRIMVAIINVYAIG